METDEPQRAMIEYCPEHRNELIKSLLANGLEEFIAKDQETMLDRMNAGQNDARMETSTLLTSLAIQVFGPVGVLEHGGCPMCAFQNIMPFIIKQISHNYITTVQ